MTQQFDDVFQAMNVHFANKLVFPTSALANKQNSFEHILPFYSHTKNTTKDVNEELGHYWDSKNVDSLIFSNLYVAPMRLKFKRIVEDDYIEVERKACDNEGMETWQSSEHYFQCAKYGPGDRAFMRGLTTGQVASYGQRRMKIEKSQLNRISTLKKENKPVPMKKNGQEYALGDTSEPQVSLPGGFDQWDKEKIGVMYDALIAKFSDQHPSLRDQLLATGNSWLVEHTRNDKQWADGSSGIGYNYLGKLLMFRREELRRIAKDNSFDSDAWRAYVADDKHVRDFLLVPMNEFMQYNE
jgi:ribA/ribD-fused uncharacterized protein